MVLLAEDVTVGVSRILRKMKPNMLCLVVRVFACNVEGPGSIPGRCTTCMFCRVGQVTGGLKLLYAYLLENLEFLFLMWALFGGT